MKKLNEFNLVEGSFEPDEAEKILIALINNKINYHEMDAFSKSERFNADTTHANMRVKKLKENAMELKSLIKHANENGWKLKIKGVIEIFVEK